MAKPNTSLILSEALELLQRGAITYEECAERYAAVWDEIGPLLRLELGLEEIADDLEQALADIPIPNIEQNWLKFSAQLRASNPGVGSTDSGGRSQPLPPAILFESKPAAVEPTPEPAQEEPANSEPLETEPEVAAPVIDFATAAARRPRRVSHRLPLLVRVAAVLLIFTVGLGSFASVVYASEPGDGLYDAKLVIDRAPVVLALSNDDRAQQELAYAQRRLKEIESLQQVGKVNKATKAVDAYQGAIKESLKYLTKVEQNRRVELQTKLEEQQGQVQSLIQDSSLSQEVKTKLDEVVTTLDEGTRQLQAPSQSPANASGPTATPQTVAGGQSRAVPTVMVAPSISNTPRPTPMAPPLSEKVPVVVNAGDQSGPQGSQQNQPPTATASTEVPSSLVPNPVATPTATAAPVATATPVPAPTNTPRPIGPANPVDNNPAASGPGQGGLPAPTKTGATATAVPATPTAVPATATAIPAAPTAAPTTPTIAPATASPVPATPTKTAVPATATAVPVTPTPTPTSTPTVAPASPTATLPPTPAPTQSSGGGGTIQNEPTPTPEVTPTRPAPTPTATLPPTSSPVPPSNTPVPPTNTAVPPTATSTPIPTNTPVPPTPTPTPIPPTNTPVPSPTPTPIPTQGRVDKSPTATSKP